MYLLDQLLRESFHRTAAVSLLIGCLLVSPAGAQTPPPDTLVLPRLSGTIDLNGRIEEPAWAQALSLPLVEMIPDPGAQPSEATEILIGYTDEYLYAACRCYDRQTPAAPSFRRDYSGIDTDYFIVSLDTFNDKENVLAFLATPSGVRFDAAVINDAAGDSPYQQDWNTFWDVAVEVEDEGWFAEMRIPFSSLRFESDGDRVVMGLTAARYFAREFSVASFPAIPSEWGTAGVYKASQAHEVEFRGIQPSRLLRISPYLLVGMTQENVLDQSRTAYRLRNDPAHDIGLDVKYGLTSNLTLDLTVNPDFAQAEADDQEVNLTRFPLFFPEKRRFFQERSSNFAFDFGGPNRLFYTRRVGLHEGQQVRIIGGARVVGRVGAWDVGVLDMQTAPEPDLGPDGGMLPGENFSVARVRRRVLNPYSYIGGILTSRIGTDGSYNVASGADGIFRVAGQEYLTLKWARTFDDAVPERLGPFEASRLLARWERRSYGGVSYDLNYAHAGSHYHPALGFELREDYFRVGDRLSYGWLPGGRSLLQRHQVSLLGTAFFRNADRSLESLEVGPEWAFRGRRGDVFSISATRQTEDLRERFAISEETSVPAGRYDFHAAEVSYAMPPSWPLRATIGVAGGGFFDGRLRSLQLSPVWNASAQVRLTGTYQFSRVRFPDRGGAFDAHVGRLRLEITPNTRFSFQPFVQYNSALGGLVGNVRFRYNPREGNDLYLVLNERLNTDRPTLDPRLPLSAGRTLLLKYTYTFH